MKITITLESDDIKEAARTLQGLANRLDTVTAQHDKKPAKPIVEPHKKTYPPLLEPDEPTAEEIADAGSDEPLVVAEEPAEVVEAAEPEDPDKPWTKKFPNGCRVCGTKKKKPMGKGLCTTCYFSYRYKY